MAVDVDVNIFSAVTQREDASVPSSGTIIGSPIGGGPVNPPNVTLNGIGITINGRVIGGKKRLILASDRVDIPSWWEYNVFALDVEGIIDIDANGMINIMDLERNGAS